MKHFIAVCLLFCAVLVWGQTAAEMEGQSGGSIGIGDHRYLGKRRVPDGSNNLLKPAGHIVAVGNFTALITNLGRHVFNDDDTISNIRGKSGKTVLPLHIKQVMADNILYGHTITIA